MSESRPGAPMPPEWFEAMVRQAPDALVFADREGVIRVWSEGAERLFGHPAAVAVGASLDLIIPERFRAAHWAGYRRAMESGVARLGGRAMTTRSMHPDGRKLYVEMSFGLVRDALGQVVGSLAMARDCTERELARRG